jgi:hypothetical protein
MTRRVSFRKADVRRTIEAAHKAGLHVTCIRPDGTIEVSEQDRPQPSTEPVEQEHDVVL